MAEQMAEWRGKQVAERMAEQMAEWIGASGSRTREG